MSSITIHLSDIKLNELNSDCLLLANKFVRELKRLDGVLLPLHSDNDVLMKISHYAKESTRPELQEIYRELKNSIKESLFDTLRQNS